MEISSFLDLPRAGSRLYTEAITVSGWLHAPGADMKRCRIRARIADEVIGETNLVFLRPDVCAALRLPNDTLTGFRFLARTLQSAPAEIIVTAAWPPELTEHEIGRCDVQLLASALPLRPYGDVVHPTQDRVLHREHIYGSGPPVEEPGAETLHLIREYVSPETSLVDVGCGAGAYAAALCERGHRWLGLEVNLACLELLEQRKLPHRAVVGPAFPCHDGEFDDAICVEVLEHIADVDGFLGEIARVIRGRALFSVPNIEVIPYFSAWQVVPWHLLEADHKNFFTRASLRALLARHFSRVEVFSYAEHPLRTPDDIALHVHLFAVAET